MTALADELAVAPDEWTASRHIAAAAATAHVLACRPRTVRWIAAATALVSVLGTGGVALAGGLPDPIQTAVADVARVLPLPIRIPYPKPVEVSSTQRPVDHPEVDTWSQAATIEASATGTEPGQAETRVEPRSAEGQTPPWLRSWDRDHSGEGPRCPPDEESGGSETEILNPKCADEFVGPPRYDQEMIDRVDGDQGDHDQSGRGDESDRERGSLRLDGSGNGGLDESHRQEERHHNESPDDDSSVGRQ